MQRVPSGTGQRAFLLPDDMQPDNAAERASAANRRGQWGDVKVVFMLRMVDWRSVTAGRNSSVFGGN